MWQKLFKIDRIVRPEATQYTYQKYILAHSLLRASATSKKCNGPNMFFFKSKLIPHSQENIKVPTADFIVLFY